LPFLFHPPARHNNLPFNILYFLTKGWDVMTLQVDTLIAVSLMMAVFSAVAAVGTSIVLGVGFERLRAGFEIISKQTGFFSDVINKLEKKVEKVDESTDSFSRSINMLEAKVGSVGEQASAFTASIQKLERKVEVVDKQTAFFSDALYKLEQQVEAIEVPQPAEETADESELISTGKAEALVAHAEGLLNQVNLLASQINDQPAAETGQGLQDMQFNVPDRLANYFYSGGSDDKGTIRYH
jgi:archaellum component FlaC